MAENLEQIKENEEKKNNNIENIDSSNIFSGFTNSGLKQEVEEIIESQKKDIFYYIQIFSNILKVIFGLIILFFIIAYTYIFIQEKADLYNSSMLDPFCFFLLGDIKYDNTYCSSITSLNNEYNKKIVELKNKQYKQIDNLLEDIYKLENFTKTKEVIFLNDKTENRLLATEIIEEFEKLKNGFEPTDKGKIKCYNIEINEDNIFKAKCDIYSSMYEKGIKGYNGTDDNLVGGTSISYVNSFLNYIEKQSDKFSHISRQKIFVSETIADVPGFTNKTNFYLELKYNSNNLSL